MIGAERETTISVDDDAEVVMIWSAQKKFITKMRANPRFTEVRKGRVTGTEWAEFTISAEEWNPVSGAKRQSRNLSEEQTEELRERMRKAQQARFDKANI